ncbi:MAG TPA: TonB-dependent receptor [Bryobacteraceae bacterium]|nr:TonB-dependent receptor [Bryobacteraceae bacterium]
MCEHLSSHRAAHAPFGKLWSPVWGAIAVTLLFTLLNQPAKAQVLFGTMVGNVTDSSSAAIPTATVKITEMTRNDVHTAQPNENGQYSVVNLPAGVYRVEISNQGFRTFIASDILVNQNNVVRVDAQLEVGSQTETVEVSAQAAALQTDRADVHAEVSTHVLENIPQPNRTWQSLLSTVPGSTPPNGQLSGGTNNPSKSMQFSFNGQGTTAAAVRVEGVSAMNPWVVQYTTFVPSVEAIQDVNIVTNAADAEQAFAEGASVNIRLKSGSNQTHGAAYEYNIITKFQANNFFSNLNGAKRPHLVDNNPGAFIGGHIIKDKLFYFGAYEGSYQNGAASGVLSLPNATMLSGNLSGSPRAIYNPLTGNANGTGRTPFPGNIIPTNMFDPVVVKLLPHFPAVTNPNLSLNNDFVNQSYVYNLHKIDTKIDYVASQKLRISGRYGYQPYYNVQQPIYGEFLGGSGGLSTCGACNYLQHGATLAISGSATYVASPTLVFDATFGVTQAHQLLFPTRSDERAGQQLGIPGANTGPLPWAGGLPNFAIANYVTFGYSYPALEYKDPIFEYNANATKTFSSHTLRFGVDIIRQHQNHIEIRPTIFTFSGNASTLNAPGAPSANEYNAMADFLLGQATTLGNYVQYIYPLTLRTWQISMYAHDQFQAGRKLTINYGVRYERYPVPTQADKGINHYNFTNNTMMECGVALNPLDCGIHVSKKLFAPSIGIAYRLTENTVIRSGYSLSPQQDNMGRNLIQGYPDEAQSTINGATSFTPAGTVSGTGAPVIPTPPFVNGIVTVPPGTGNLFTNPTNFRRGYIQSYNFTIQRQFKGDITAQVGYVGGHSVNLFTNVNFNYGQLGGGAASQPLFRYGITANATNNIPFLSDKYNSLQSSFQKRFSHGLTVQGQFTYSHDIGVQSATTAILVPQYSRRNSYATAIDRTFNFTLLGNYELPFGKGKPYLRSGVAAFITGGWSVNGIFTRFSGTPFTVTSSAGSCNCPGNSQTANQVLPDVSFIGNGINGAPYFNPAAYAPVTTTAFGNSGYNTLRGPGATNLDLSLFRTFSISERFKVQIRGESLNISNTPHFANPTTANLNVSNYNPNSPNLGGFGQITQTAQLSRLLDQRYFRFGFRIIF